MILFAMHNCTSNLLKLFAVDLRPYRVVFIGFFLSVHIGDLLLGSLSMMMIYHG